MRDGPPTVGTTNEGLNKPGGDPLLEV